MYKNAFYLYENIANNLSDLMIFLPTYKIFTNWIVLMIVEHD